MDAVVEPTGYAGASTALPSLTRLDLEGSDRDILLEMPNLPALESINLRRVHLLGLNELIPFKTLRNIMVEGTGPTYSQIKAPEELKDKIDYCIRDDHNNCQREVPP